ncbi:MAG: hypothetical protein GY804_14250 [Alphaproteobacteria bacterium]|nr:hypothetical protein [Alphaproteobacteria bacterium]
MSEKSNQKGILLLGCGFLVASTLVSCAGREIDILDKGAIRQIQRNATDGMDKNSFEGALFIGVTEAAVEFGARMVNSGGRQGQGFLVEKYDSRSNLDGNSGGFFTRLLGGSNTGNRGNSGNRAVSDYYGHGSYVDEGNRLKLEELHRRNERFKAKNDGLGVQTQTDRLDTANDALDNTLYARDIKERAAIIHMPVDKVQAEVNKYELLIQGAPDYNNRINDFFDRVGNPEGELPREHIWLPSKTENTWKAYPEDFNSKAMELYRPKISHNYQNGQEQEGKPSPTYSENETMTASAAEAQMPKGFSDTEYPGTILLKACSAPVKAGIDSVNKKAAGLVEKVAAAKDKFVAAVVGNSERTV